MSQKRKQAIHKKLDGASMKKRGLNFNAFLNMQLAPDSVNRVEEKVFDIFERKKV